MEDDFIFMPETSIYDKCYVVQSSDVIRGYDRVPAYNTNYNYRDYYINSSYIFRDGQGTWNNYSSLPVCLSSDIITNDFYYRLDFDKILIMFIILSFFCFYIPLKIFSKLFRKGGL